MSSTLRRDIPLAIVFLVGLITLIDYFFTFDPVSSVVSITMNFGTIIIGFLYAVGGISLVIYEYKQYQSRPSKDPTKWLSLYVIGIMALFFYAGVLNPGLYSWLIANVSNATGIGINGVIGCAIVLAAYRAFRARSLDATALLITGIITMFQLAPIGEVISPAIPASGLWILNVLTRAANRGMQIGLGIGGVYTAIRTWLGMEARATGI